MSPKKQKKKSLKDRQQERQRKQQRAQEAYAIQRAAQRRVQRRAKWSKGRVLGAFCVVFLIFGVYGVWQFTQPSTAPPPITPPATPLVTPYAFSLDDVNGSPFSLASHQGRVIVVHIMGVGCHGQIDPINDNQLTQLKTVCSNYCGSQPVTVVTVAVATCPTSDLEQIRATYGITWTLGNDYDDGTMDIAQQYASRGDGTIVLIDKTFHVSDAFGAVTASTLTFEIDQLLGA